MPLQNFVDKNIPVISAGWLNSVDKLLFNVFGNAVAKATARIALTQDLPMEVTNGGTGVRTLSDLLSNLFASYYPKIAAENSIPTAEMDLRYWIGHVQRYKAAGDGATNDTLAFQRALNVAYAIKGTVWIPANFIMAVDPGIAIVFTGNRFTSGLNIQGCGMSSIIRVRGTPTGFTLIEMRGATPTANPQDAIIRMRDFVIEKGGAISGTGLQLNNVGNFDLDIVIRGFDKNLEVQSALIGKINGSYTDGNWGIYGRQNGFPGTVGVTAGSTVNLITVDPGCRLNYNAKWALDIDHGSGWLVDGDTEANGTPGDMNTGNILIGANLAPDAFVAKIQIVSWNEANFGLGQIVVSTPVNGSYNSIVIQPRALLASEGGRAIAIGGARNVRVTDVTCGPGENWSFGSTANLTLINARTDTLTDTNVGKLVYLNSGTSTTEHSNGRYSNYDVGLGGVTPPVNSTIFTEEQGDDITLYVLASITGVSSGNQCTVTILPTRLRPAATRILWGPVLDNGIVAFSQIDVEAGGALRLYWNGSTTGFTGSGNKGLLGCVLKYRR